MPTHSGSLWRRVCSHHKSTVNLCLFSVIFRVCMGKECSVVHVPWTQNREQAFIVLLYSAIAQLSHWINPMDIAQRLWVKHQLTFSWHWAQYFLPHRSALSCVFFFLFFFFWWCNCNRSMRKVTKNTSQRYSTIRSCQHIVWRLNYAPLGLI